MADSIGSRIRATREEYGMSQAELGRRLGLRRQQMHSIEWDRQRPTGEQVAAIARILRVNGNYLLGLSADKTYRPSRAPGGEGDWQVRSLLQDFLTSTTLSEQCVVVYALLRQNA